LNIIINTCALKTSSIYKFTLNQVHTTSFNIEDVRLCSMSFNQLYYSQTAGLR